MTERPGTIHLSPDVVRRARWFRWTGAIVLLLGLSAAVVVYWAGIRSASLHDDAAMTGFNRASERQMAMLYGKQGRFVEDLTRSLKEPGTQAILIVAVAVVMAAASFYIAHLLTDEAKRNQPMPEK